MCVCVCSFSLSLSLLHFRPHARNAVDADTADRLHEAFERFEADVSAKV